MFAQALARSFRLHRSGIALIHDKQEVGWEALGRSVAGVAGALRKAGIRLGDRVAVLADNSPAHATAMYAIAWAGAVLVPLNTRLSVSEMAQILAESGAVALFSDAANASAAQQLRRDLPLKSYGLGAGASGQDWAASCGHAAVDAATCPMTELAAIYYTGGTTGAPKGVMLSDGALLMQGMTLCDELSIRRQSIVHQAPPLFHLAGAGVAHACVLAGATQIYAGHFDAAGLLRTVAERRATHVSVVPTMLSVMMELDGVSDAFRSVERMIYGTSSITEAALRKVIAACPNAEMTQIYGQTECAGACLFLPPEDHALDGPRRARLVTAGRPNIFSEVRLVDAADQPVAPGTPGEITIRGPSVMLGYWQKPDVTADALRGGWLHTGDVGLEDEAGYIRIVDRIKDMIVSGGENVFCAEVENAIATHAEVSFCAVVGLPDARWGERVHAVIGRTAGSALGEAAVIAHCRALIAHYKCPKTVSFTTEPLPLSPVGKVRKDLLRARLIQKTGAVQ
ncbi:class I adenylate-forming enzyme family protein [Paracoccus sp. (in: a-proteobacteria)]|uniref:class I adenylate-forming enzyme family protein n=1 Tax=Paracoccus sp. TaxID=267 RepID=UPI003A85D21D